MPCVIMTHSLVWSSRPVTPLASLSRLRTHGICWELTRHISLCAAPAYDRRGSAIMSAARLCRCTLATASQSIPLSIIRSGPVLPGVRDIPFGPIRMRLETRSPSIAARCPATMPPNEKPGRGRHDSAHACFKKLGEFFCCVGNIRQVGLAIPGHVRHNHSR